MVRNIVYVIVSLTGDLTRRFSKTDFRFTIGVSIGEGGPFGAIVARNREIVSRAHNIVLQTNDPTAHAEVTAIRKACAKLGRFSLHDCVLYVSCEPCPMCFSAIHWAKIPRCIFSASPDDAAAAGFDDRFLYDALQGKTDEKKCDFENKKHPNSDLPFKAYADALAQNKSGLY